VAIYGQAEIDLTLPKDMYYLSGMINIPNGVTLTVESGTVIRSIGYTYTINVSGKLVAMGTAENTIVFTTVNDSEYGGNGVSTSYQGYWNGINVFETGEFTGDYVKVRYGGAWGNNSSTLNIFGKLALTNSEVSNAYQTGIYFKTEKDSYIKNCKIRGSNYGISLNNTGIGCVLIDGNIISKNIYAGISLNTTGTGTVTIENNTIIGNTYNGISIGQFGTGTLIVKNNNITNSEDAVSVNLGGLKSSSVFSCIQGNTYIDNTYNGVAIYGQAEIDLTLPKDMYYLSSMINIPSGVTLTVESGTVIRSIGYTYTINVSGKLVAMGTAVNNIVFTTVNDSEYGGNGVSTSYQGYWNGINVFETGEFTGDYVKVRYGGAWGNNSSTLNILGKLALTNSEVSNAYQTGIYFKTEKDSYIKNCKIKGSNYGISLNNTEDTTILIEHNLISDNNYLGLP
jgi:formylmethanofuran dehydrogenase subunit E